LVSSATIISVTALTTGAVWAVLAANPDRKAEIKGHVISFAKFVLVMVTAAAIYYFPPDWTSMMTEWLTLNPWGVKLVAIPLYFGAAVLLLRLIRRIWT